MPVARFEMPDGRIARFEVPEGTTPEQAHELISAAIPEALKSPAITGVPSSGQTTGIAEIPGKALSNLPGSAMNFAQGIYSAVRHPVDTAGNLLDAAAGGLHNVLPDAVSSAIDRIDPNPAAGQRAVNTANAVGGFYKDRYGSAEGIKNTLATDPVGVASDLSVLLSGGAALAGKLPQAAKLADVLTAGAKYTNPMSAVEAGITRGVPAIGRGLANVVGGVGTHTGGQSLQEAARAGLSGGSQQQALIANMRGNVPMADVLETAKANLEKMGRDKSAAYRAGMAQVSGDRSVLDFSGIDKALADAAGTVSFKGQVKNVKAAQVLQSAGDEIAQWKALNPAEFHTPEGLDALKQKVGGIVESIPFEEKTARMVGSKIYNSIKDEIVKQAPVYADTMKGYADATEQIREIERTLSLGGKASVDTAMRKLQSLMRNNANTNYGNRLDLAKALEQQGGQDIMPALAGQSLNTWTPRGLGSAVAGGLGLGGYAMGGPSAAVPILAAQSPRLMGEAALKSGQAARLMGNAIPEGIDPVRLGNLLYQMGRLPSQE